jgi:multidrug resistance efflux pump
MLDTENKEPHTESKKPEDEIKKAAMGVRYKKRTAEPAVLSSDAKPRLRTLPIFLTFTVVAIAAALSWAMWNVYMAAPWTRDATVRVYIVTVAPQVAGQIVRLPLKDNQFVRNGDLLMVIDPTNYKIAVNQAAAALDQAKANAQDAQAQYDRRKNLTTLSTSIEEKQIYEAKALSTKAAVEQASATLEQARVNLERTEIRSPVNGYITNLLAQLGNYSNAGVNQLSIVNTDSYWIDGYFEETQLAAFREGDPVHFKLMGSNQTVRGHVSSLARGIQVPNAQPDAAGLAKVNPIFTWVRLAQRVPVRIQIDEHPKDVPLVAGMTATVEVKSKDAGMSSPSSQVTQLLNRLGLNMKRGDSPQSADARNSRQELDDAPRTRAPVENSAPLLGDVPRNAAPKSDAPRPLHSRKRHKHRRGEAY